MSHYVPFSQCDGTARSNQCGLITRFLPVRIQTEAFVCQQMIMMMMHTGLCDTNGALIETTGCHRDDTDRRRDLETNISWKIVMWGWSVTHRLQGRLIRCGMSAGLHAGETKCDTDFSPPGILTVARRCLRHSTREPPPKAPDKKNLT